MNANLEPFHGTWRFNPDLSAMCTPAPQSWIQEIKFGLNELAVREEIVRTDGTEIVLSVQARFDGADYPVEGSHAVDTIAYTRTDRNAICGIGKKDGQVSFTETVLADPHAHTLTLIYNYVLGQRTVTHGIAVFEAA
jgi:hypothetical protein